MKLAVNVNRWTSPEKPKNVLDVVVRSFEIATTYRHPLKNNEIIIEPHLEAFSPSDFNKADQLASEGYRAATLLMPEIKSRAGEKAPDFNLWEQFKSWFRA